MKLWNTIVVYDIYTVAESFEEANAAAVASIRAAEEPLTPSEQTSLEVREGKHVRAAWVEQNPIVAGDISDADFETLKGKNTMQIHEMLHTKKGQPK